MRIYNNWQKSAFIITSTFFFFGVVVVPMFYYSYLYMLKIAFGQTNICIRFICGYMHYIYAYCIYTVCMCVLYVHVYIFIFISLYMCIYEMDIVV